MAKRASKSSREAAPTRARRRAQQPGPPPVQPCGVPFPTVGLGFVLGPPFNPLLRRAVRQQADAQCIANAVATCQPNPLCPQPSFVRILLDITLPPIGPLLVHIVVAEWICVPPRAKPIPFPRRGADGGFEG